jgi:hypothetical protein
MVSCPHIVKWVAVSTTIRPVTHTADVAVKNPFRMGNPRPSVVVNGIVNTSVPRRMTARNPTIIVWAG